MLLPEPLIFERGARGRRGWSAGPATPGPVEALPPGLAREDDLEGLPEVGELEVLRHFVRLSQWNFSAATTMYPLGSCTMKYNPVVNEDMARLEGFAALHPLMPDAGAQGALQVIWELEEALKAVSGLPAVSVQPAAGAQGELLGMLMIRAFHQRAGGGRTRVLIPASAHGTNPASSALCGYDVVEVPVGEGGTLEADAVARVMDDSIAALMVTNPNTLGLFEVELERIAAIVHARGGLVYMDGANMNALMGVAKPGDMGVDVMQFNLHKTFSTPHGGGGPGAGPIAVATTLAPFLPGPRVVKRDGQFTLEASGPGSVGRVRSFHGNFGILVRALAYLLRVGGPGLAEVTRLAILNANYLRARLAGTYHVALDRPALHECVFSDKWLQPHGVQTLDVAKGLLDHGFYAPTIYFPLVVKGAIMVEPTETESMETLDAFADAMVAIAEQAKTDAEGLHSAPHRTWRSRLDETRAARRPVLRWRPAAQGGGEAEKN
jgi:glycine dehydrogenase subunit 2